MKTYNTIKCNDIEYWYRITGNSYGWKISVQQPATPQRPLQDTISISMSFWNQPTDKIERKKFYDEMATELAQKL